MFVGERERGYVTREWGLGGCGVSTSSGCLLRSKEEEIKCMCRIESGAFAEENHHFFPEKMDDVPKEIYN